MEKCYQIMDNQTDQTKLSTMETLKNLYFRLRNKDMAKWQPKYQEMDEKIKSFKQ